MEQYIIGVLILGLIIGFFIGKLLSKSSYEKRISELEIKNKLLLEDKEDNISTINKLNDDKVNLNNEKHALDLKLADKLSELKYLEEKLQENKAEVEKLQEKFTKDFEILANRILEEKSSKFTLQNKENIKNILEPLQAKIQTFEKKVEDINKEDIQRNSALIQKIKSLESLNQQMSQDAINLTNALKGESKTQGDWGEIQLEVLLEKAGLTKGLHFTTQGGFRDDNDLLKKPDFIINLPDNKQLIIDSKVSLTAYENYFNAEDDVNQKIALKNHLISIRKHFKELGEKNYTNLYGINTPDYVLMFVPIEPALLIALHEENKIYLEALDRNVVLVSTSTLLATLSTVASIWKQEDQKRNVMEIAKESGLLYDKFEGFVQDLIKIGKALNSSQESYQNAMNKLSSGRGNMIKKIENLKKLGAKTKNHYLKIF
ncbi:DNA recombination protein RmuC [Lutibacter profundi]|uniref:DNA recombination protein RmuC n=1 Tax=Lutibacter profundi TaxID=1622118 RepID=UPI000B0818AD|nr:DNA recombination protein RmuC [Lutibacter profundi]